MQTNSIFPGDKVRHKTQLVNGNAPMTVSAVNDKQARCEHFEPNEEGGTTHKQTWFDVEELDKI